MLKAKILLHSAMLTSMVLASTVRADDVATNSESFVTENNLVAGKTPITLYYKMGSTAIVETHDPRKDSNNLMTVKIEKENDNVNFTVKRHMWWLYSAMKKYDVHHTLESDLGQAVYKALETMQIKEKTEYKGKVIVDEYNKSIPMYWFFETVNDFRDTATYLKANAVAKTNKPLFMLEIDDDANLESLSTDDLAFLSEYFSVPSTKEQLYKLSNFFAESKKNLRETTARAARGELKLGKDPRAYLNYHMVKECGEFKAEKLLPKISKYIAVALVFTYGLKKTVSLLKQTPDGIPGLSWFVKDFLGFKVKEDQMAKFISLQKETNEYLKKFTSQS